MKLFGPNRKKFSGPVPVLLDVSNGSRKARAQQRLTKAHAIVAGSVEVAGGDDGFPQQAFPAGGKQRTNSLRGSFRLRQRPFSETAFSFATAYPFLAGANLGHQARISARMFTAAGRSSLTRGSCTRRKSSPACR